MTELERELNRTINMLMAHPDNEPNSEFADRIDSLIDLKKAITVTRCCTELPTKEEMFDENGRKVFEIENSNKTFSKHTPYLLGFSSGFQKCYEWLTK